YLLSNGNYLIFTPNWNSQSGAVTWANGSTGVSGTVSDANSLVGSNPGDQIGSQLGGHSITSLNNGNYVILSPYWNGGLLNGRRAVTWLNGSTGVHGVVSEANSMVGVSHGDRLGIDLGGQSQITVLNNGNYVVDDPIWNGGRGAVTWADGNTGITGTVSD